MSFFSGLEFEGYDRQYTDRQLIQRVAEYFRPYSRKIIIISTMLVVIAIASAALPVLVGRGIDLMGADLNPATTTLLIAAVLATGVITWGANWVRRRLSAQAIGDVILNLQSNAFQAASAHDLSFYDQYASGRILSRITTDTQDFAQVAVIVTDLVTQMVQTILLAVVLVLTEWRLALLLFAILPVIFIVALSFRRMARRVTSRGMRGMANVNTAIKETVSGISIAKNFRQEAAIYGEFDNANNQSYQANIQRGFVLSLVFPTLNALNAFGWALLVYTGGLTVVQGLVSAGSWYLFMLSLDKFWFPVLNLSAFWAQIQSGLAASERIFALIDAEPAVIQLAEDPPPPLKGEICFERVNFSYIADEQILADFDLHIQAGENLALVGHTGAGKSSIAKLIARFYEFQDGRIMVDGHDIRTFNLQAYRQRLGIVSQVPFLFSGTVAENIRYAVPDASDTEILQLARQIGEGEWLETLPDGLDTQVGERGNLLSMGQRQLVSLLRVLVQRPAIFILDEATASIDPFTEWQIQQALHLILAETTSILIAHRLSTVKAADRIVVLEKGKIIEEGNHNNLLTQKGHYADLYNTYFRHQSLAYVEQARSLSGDE
jgi:ATP-binding cassette subfamily B protein